VSAIAAKGKSNQSEKKQRRGRGIDKKAKSQRDANAKKNVPGKDPETLKRRGVVEKRKEGNTKKQPRSDEKTAAQRTKAKKITTKKSWQREKKRKKAKTNGDPP